MFLVEWDIAVARVMSDTFDDSDLEILRNVYEMPLLEREKNNVPSDANVNLPYKYALFKTDQSAYESLLFKRQQAILNKRLKRRREIAHEIKESIQAEKQFQVHPPTKPEQIKGLREAFIVAGIIPNDPELQAKLREGYPDCF